MRERAPALESGDEHRHTRWAQLAALQKQACQMRQTALGEGTPKARAASRSERVEGERERVQAQRLGRGHRWRSEHRADGFAGEIVAGEPELKQPATAVAVIVVNLMCPLEQQRAEQLAGMHKRIRT